MRNRTLGVSAKVIKKGRVVVLYREKEMARCLDVSTTGVAAIPYP